MSGLSVLRRDTDHAMRLLLYLAEVAGNRCVPVGQVAAATGAPPAVAHKCVQKLREAGIVVCRRGAAGGVRLAVPARDVRISNVIGAMQGPIALCRCLADETACPRRDGCRLSRGLARVQERFAALLDETTLATLLAAPARGGARRRRGAGPKQTRREES